MSMADTFYDKEYIIIDKISYRELPVFGPLREPQRGDVVVFRPEVDKQKKFYIKRIIWIPGDTLKIEKGYVYVRPQGREEFTKLEEGYLNDYNNGATYVKWDKNLVKEYTIAEGDYYVIWDNRNGSTDSRDCFKSCSLWTRDEFITKDNIAWIVLMDLGYFNFSKLEFKNAAWENTFPRFLNLAKTYEYEYEQ